MATLVADVVPLTSGDGAHILRKAPAHQPHLWLFAKHDLHMITLNDQRMSGLARLRTSRAHSLTPFARRTRGAAQVCGQETCVGDALLRGCADSRVVV